MFRKMRRFKQALTTEECNEVLREEWRGNLAVLGDDDYPYTIPINFYYDEEKQVIYFHGAGTGHKIDAIKRHDKVSFNVIDKGTPHEGSWSLDFKSVTCFGRIRIMENQEEAIAAVTKLGIKYYPTVESAMTEVEKDGKRVTMLELSIEHMTGKKVNEE